MLDAEQRERARLAESLHDGPMQRLVALRQDAGDGTSRDELAGHLDRRSPRRGRSSPSSIRRRVRELGFEASLRAAVAPFPAAAAVVLTVDSDVDDHALAEYAR